MMLSVQITNKAEEAAGIVSLELSPIGVSSLPRFSAGSHIDIHLKNGLIRQYSLCNPPDETHRYVIAVLRDARSRGGSIAVHDEISLGDVLVISEPKNLFPLVQSGKALLFAGGIGITPVLCMAEYLSAAGSDFEMHYCTRSRISTAFESRILSSKFLDKAYFHFDDGPVAQKLDLTKTLSDVNFDTHIYVCGPAGFITYIVDSAKALGWPPANIHLEVFGGAPVDHSGDGSFNVKIASSGAVFNIPANATVIQALLEQGISIPVSCEQGVCGTCLTGVLDGEPDHKDMYLSEEEKAKGDCFMPCCSRAKGKMLVLDL